VTTTTSTTGSGPGGGQPDEGGGASPPTEVRSWGWHVMQVSAWLLVVALPIHVWSIWLAHDPGRFGVATFVDRWHTAGWRVFDWAFLMLALAHGGIGLSGVLSSLTRNETVRTVIAAVTAVVLTLLAVLVSATIFSFDIS
jgi:succinate dehydrogenase hydrophobic anchor subunit